MSVPWYCLSAPMRASIEATSRCVVGSSMSRRFGGSSNSLTRASRDFSPPLKTATVLKTHLFAQLTARLEALPQVKSAAVGYDVPLTGFQASTAYAIDFA